MNKNAYQKLLLCVKYSYKKTAELIMKTAADEVRNLVVSKKNDTVNEDDSPTNENANIDADDNHSNENSIIADNEFIANTVVSSDGSWQKKGYDSLNGIVTIIQNDVGKCIHFHVKVHYLYKLRDATRDIRM